MADTQFKNRKVSFQRCYLATLQSLLLLSLSALKGVILLNLMPGKHFVKVKIGYLFARGFGMDFAKPEVVYWAGGMDNAGRHAVNSSERRRYKRLPVKLDLSCCKVDSSTGRFYTGRTVNVNPRGLYFETAADVFKPGNLLRVELSIPPTTGLLEFGGRISGLAKVLRTCNICDSLLSGRYGVALEFCRPPKLST